MMRWSPTRRSIVLYRSSRVPRPGHRRQLLDAAVKYAHEHGVRFVEGYPSAEPGRSNGEWLWHGTQSMFGEAGFEEVARR